MAGEVGNNIDYDHVWAFTFEIEGVEAGQFESAGPLKQTAATAEQRVGGKKFIQAHSTTTVKSENITLKRGASSDDQLWKWWQNTKTGVQDKRNCTLIQNDSEGNPIREYPLSQCLIIEYEAGTWDATKDGEFQHETVVLKYIDFDRVET